MKKIAKEKTAGFTLVELLVVVVVVGIVALIFVQAPLFSVSSWRAGTERLKMQRDANNAMLKIQRVLRPKHLPNISVSGSQLITGSGSEKFYLNDGTYQLFYVDPTGSQEVLTEGDAGTTFTPSISNGTVNINFILKRGNVQTTLVTEIKPRN